MHLLLFSVFLPCRHSLHFTISASPSALPLPINARFPFPPLDVRPVGRPSLGLWVVPQMRASVSARHSRHWPDICCEPSTTELPPLVAVASAPALPSVLPGTNDTGERGRGREGSHRWLSEARKRGAASIPSEGACRV